MVVVIAEENLGLSGSTVESLRDLLAPVPYGPTLVWIAGFAGRLTPVRRDADAQLELARDVFGGARVVAAMEEFLRIGPGGEERYLFSEQQMHVVARLVLESAEGPADDRTWNEERENRMRRGLLGATTLIGDGASKIRSKGRGLEDWLGFFAQHGAYNSTGQPLLAYQRTWRLFGRRAGARRSAPDGRVDSGSMQRALRPADASCQLTGRRTALLPPEAS